jgi:hypothetical protein
MAKTTASKKATPNKKAKVVEPTERDIRIEHIISSAKEFNLSAGAVYRQFALMLHNDAETERYEATKHDLSLSKKEQRKLSGDAVAKLWADIYEIDQTYTTDSLSKICGVGGFLQHGIDNQAWTLLEIDLLLGFTPTYLQNNKLIRGLEKATADGKSVECTVEALREVNAFKPEPKPKGDNNNNNNNNNGDGDGDGDQVQGLDSNWLDTLTKLTGKILEDGSCAPLSVHELAMASKQLQALAEVVKGKGEGKAIELGLDFQEIVAEIMADSIV